MKKEKIIIIIIALIIGACMIGGKIFMNNEEKTYGYCGSKCKHEVIKKDNFYVFEGEKIYPKNYMNDIYYMELPDGFTEENAVVVSRAINIYQEDPSNYSGYTSWDYFSNDFTAYNGTDDINFSSYITIDASTLIFELKTPNATRRADTKFKYRIMLYRFN